MALDKDFDGNNDIAQFLEKFKEQPFPSQANPEDSFAATPSVRPGQYARSFEKLEQKIHELEEKFEASTTQNRLILTELARTREVVERQKDKDAFLEHLSRTIASLRTSVENLSRTQAENTFSFREPTTQRSFDPLPEVYPAESTFNSVEVQAQLQREREEQTRRFNSLRQKASQLKAVNSALDREIKKAQQEKMEALKKSADQAKEILSLRDQLSAAEERFKSFDFEGRIISIKQEYQQKVTNLETRLKEMSDTCMQQVEQIESLKAENTKLQNASAEKEALQAQLASKERELAALRETIATLQNQNAGEHTKRLSVFTAQLRALEEQRDRLAIELEQSQISLETIRSEKEMLEQNFKELVAKINQNDEVISQLKQKIEVLGQQNSQLNEQNSQLIQNNEQLAQANAALSQNNEDLSHDNAELTQRNFSLVQHNEQLVTHNVTLSQRTQALEGEAASLKNHIEQLNADKQVLAEQTQELNTERQTLHEQVEMLSKDKEKLTQDNKTLSSEHDNLQTEAQTWKKEVQSLSEENQQLRTQSAALLAARLVQEHHQKQAAQRAKEEMSQSQERKETASAAQPLRRPSAPILHSLGRTLAVSSSRADENWEVIPAKRTVPPAAPKTRIETPEDLPEIKVTQSPVEEPMFDDEDFLEKTNSFIGRMKWSIFRENR